MGIDVAALAAAHSTGVVGVRSGAHRSGSGTVVAEGTVVTTAHNARADTVEVTFADGTVILGDVASAWDQVDLAVIHADTSAATPLTGRRSEPLSIGGEIVAMGAPAGIARVTAGAVATTAGRFRTAVGSPVAGALEHTAPLPRGSSGGPVLDADGALVGVNVNRLDGGLYQAVPADLAFDELVAKLGSGQIPVTRQLGITVVHPRRARQLRAAVGLAPAEGVLVGAVDPTGAAAEAGLARGDLLTALDGHPLRIPDDLLLRLRAAPERITLTVMSGAGVPREVQVSFT